MDVMGVTKSFQLRLKAYFTEGILNDAVNLVNNTWLWVIWPIIIILSKGYSIKLPSKYSFY